ncbi:MAG: MATE family efflux transporter [Kiritimatiellia bacterium]
MMDRSHLRELAEEPLGRLLARFSWPALVSMTLNALYAIVDRVYIGHGCGTDAMAGLTLAFPIMMVFGAFGVFVGAGHAAVLSIKLGEGDRPTCEKILGELIALKLLFFFILPPLVFAFLDPILRWTGGAGVTAGALEQAKVYLRIVLFSHVFSHLAFGLSATMRSEGAVVSSMMCMVVGFGTNLVLDPIFIFGLGMGVAGAAWATVAAMALSCAWAFAYYRPGHSVVRLRLRRIGFYRAILGRAAGIGLSPALQQLMGSLVNVSLQMALARWSADQAEATSQIAALGIFQMVMLMFLMPVLGIQQGLAPIFGFNWGARSYARVRGALVLGLWITTVLVTVAALAQVICPELIARIFTDGTDPAFLRLAGQNLRISNCMLWCIGINVVATTYFQSIGHPWTATFLSILRQFLILIPCIWILPHVFADHTFAVWLALPISDVLCQLATLPPLVSHLRFLRRLGREDGRRPPRARGLRGAVLVLFVCLAGPALAWGPGHDVVARETLRVLPGAWGERLRAGAGGACLLKACHAPDDTKTTLDARAVYLDAELRAHLAAKNGKPATMFRLHAADARCELVRALARALRAGNDAAAGFVLGCLNHSIADTVSANHSPLIQLVTYNWADQGLTDAVPTDCAILDATPQGRRILREVVDALDLAEGPQDAPGVYAALYGDELAGTTYYRYDVDFAAGGEPALRAFAAEVAFAVRRTCEVFRAAVAFAARPEIPAFDAKAVAAGHAAAARKFLAARSVELDSIARGLWPEPGRAPEIGVVFDPTGFWTRGVVYMANRTLAVQIVTTLRATRDAALLDLREVMRGGVPAGVRTLVVPGSGLGDHMGFAAADFLRAVEAFAAKGGRVVWVGGNPRPPTSLFPEAARFTANPAPTKWARMRGAVAAEEMAGGALEVAGGVRFPCVRPPIGKAGWYWQQLELAFLPPRELPAGARPVVEFVAKDGARTTVGYAVANRVFVPAFALYPSVFTERTPSVRPLRLELDAAGEAVLNRALSKEEP